MKEKFAELILAPLMIAFGIGTMIYKGNWPWRVPASHDIMQWGLWLDWLIGDFSGAVPALGGVALFADGLVKLKTRREIALWASLGISLTAAGLWILIAMK